MAFINAFVGADEEKVAIPEPTSSTEEKVYAPEAAVSSVGLFGFGWPMIIGVGALAYLWWKS